MQAVNPHGRFIIMDQYAHIAGISNNDVFTGLIWCLCPYPQAERMQAKKSN
jgi:hypothetical protein